MTTILRKYWPYDEVKISKDPSLVSNFFIDTPWLNLRVQIPADQINRSENFFTKLNSQSLSADDLDDINWFFTSLSKYPFSYILPRGEAYGINTHQIKNQKLPLETPAQLLNALSRDSKQNEAITRVGDGRLAGSWTWDMDAAISFSQTANGLDPQSLFSITRRFHLLNDIENNKTAELLEFVQSLKGNPEKFRDASALILRQNHYVTEQCESVLRASLAIAQSAYEEIIEFIQAESGHDKILEIALSSLGIAVEKVEVLDTTKTLMEIFRFAAGKNLLAFAMITDIFERTSYRKEDPLSSVLTEGGEVVAGRQIDVHRDINDAGGHENVALEFLNDMSAVDEDYAREAMALAELATLVVHQISKQTLENLKLKK